ncbi:hypothetical protein ACF09J_14715 [Streptomyces sp. NPDC014889]|uniref:hypothetical protein n=1 Tax=Streptomyces sp. NPDC014889 TaxID=3364928 RepID=UPI0036FE70EC
MLSHLARRDVGRQVLIEEYLDAPEFSWEALVEEGEVIFGDHTRKVTTGPPEFVELQHQLPYLPADRDRVDRQTAALVAAAGIRTGIVHDHQAPARALLLRRRRCRHRHRRHRRGGRGRAADGVGCHTGGDRLPLRDFTYRT